MDKGIVIQVDLLTLLAVTGLVLVAAVVAGVIRRSQHTRRIRRIEQVVTRIVVDALDGRCQHGDPPRRPSAGCSPQGTSPEGGPAEAPSSTALTCNSLAALCVALFLVGWVAGSQHLIWVSLAALVAVPLVAAPWLTRRQAARGEPVSRYGWNGFDSWWRLFGFRL